MLKKITVIGTIGILILVAIGLSFFNDSIQDEDSDLIVESDVIMPTKVSRPGCEENDQCYIPSQIVIEKGKQVTWLNEDSAFHSVTSGFYDAPTDLFDSGYLDPYQSFSLTFDETGIYDYHCTLHPWMEGQVTVE
ncbi:MAG: plastocyanin/azurin family copper-binding protein [Nitrosopumilus sp.]|nr:plastocyanin/azurin family copper-binding protein [Nitrosopumilus sp.]MDH3736325.1 plastocyanin/azurin family copper-binding protein [Nitrosopumilus sp.]MDH3824022.1 plastocyanin/azurin family copper-binding protein [Nitrosopumilus sp.]MDH3833712.1 plastocyanin/azurin family copper-binding protein [Nitrosopumilus sp.]